MNDWDISEARFHAHQAFDQLWLRKYMTRSQAYEWLASYLGATEAEAHIANLNGVQCRALIQRAHEEVALRAAALGRRVLTATIGEVVSAREASRARTASRSV